MIKLDSEVKALIDFDKYGVKRGATGTVVHMGMAGEVHWVIVEFELGKKSRAVITSEAYNFIPADQHSEGLEAIHGANWL